MKVWILHIFPSRFQERHSYSVMKKWLYLVSETMSSRQVQNVLVTGLKSFDSTTPNSLRFSIHVSCTHETMKSYVVSQKWLKPVHSYIWEQNFLCAFAGYSNWLVEPSLGTLSTFMFRVCDNYLLQHAPWVFLCLYEAWNRADKGGPDAASKLKQDKKWAFGTTSLGDGVSISYSPNASKHKGRNKIRSEVIHTCTLH